jgi:hypothetical protein
VPSSPSECAIAGSAAHTNSHETPDGFRSGCGAIRSGCGATAGRHDCFSGEAAARTRPRRVRGRSGPSAPPPSLAPPSSPWGHSRRHGRFRPGCGTRWHLARRDPSPGNAGPRGSVARTRSSPRVAPAARLSLRGQWSSSLPISSPLWTKSDSQQGMDDLVEPVPIVWHSDSDRLAAHRAGARRSR